MGGQRFGEDDAQAFDKAAAHVAAYRRSLANGPLAPARDYAQKLAEFDEPLPEHGLASGDVVDDLIERVEGGLLDISSPRFFGFVMGAAHPASVAADMMVSGWNQNTAMIALTPTTCAIEEITRRWLLELLDLPRESSLGVCTGATMANAIGLAAARNELLRRSGWDVEADGLFNAPEVHVVRGAEAHSSIDASLRLIGFGAKRVHIIAADRQGRMIPAELHKNVATLKGPIIIIAQAGNINSGASDPMTEIADIARSCGAWMHVDGAFGLWAHAHPELREQVAGLDRADSWAADGHKWLQAAYDCGFVFVRNAAAHAAAMGHSAAYLPNSHTIREPGDFVPELSRRARATPAWAAIKAFGREGIVEMIGRNCRLARQMAERLALEPGVTVLNQVALNQVAVTFGPEGELGDLQTADVLAQVQAGHVCYPSHGVWQGRKTLRLSVSGHATSPEDASAACDAIISAWRTCQERAA